MAAAFTQAEGRQWVGGTSRQGVQFPCMVYRAERDDSQGKLKNDFGASGRLGGFGTGSSSALGRLGGFGRLGRLGRLGGIRHGQLLCLGQAGRLWQVGQARQAWQSFGRGSFLCLGQEAARISSLSRRQVAPGRREGKHVQLRCLHGVWSRVGDSHGKLKNDFGASGFFAAGGAAQGKSTQHQCSACTLLLTACSLQNASQDAQHGPTMGQAEFRIRGLRSPTRWEVPADYVDQALNRLSRHGALFGRLGRGHARGRLNGGLPDRLHQLQGDGLQLHLRRVHAPSSWHIPTQAASCMAVAIQCDGHDIRRLRRDNRWGEGRAIPLSFTYALGTGMYAVEVGSRGVEQIHAGATHRRRRDENLLTSLLLGHGRALHRATGS